VPTRRWPGLTAYRVGVPTVSPAAPAAPASRLSYVTNDIS
jgi:hypothetical protein